MKSVHKNNFRRQRRVEKRLGETVRIASIVQKGMNTGRSNYVEMSALNRLTNHNIKARINQIRILMKIDTALDELLSKTVHIVAEGYTDVLTPNGIIREKDLDHLLSIDSDIVTCLRVMEREKSKNPDIIETLKGLLEQRKKIVESLKA
jgi:hypothetical protein